MEKSWESLAVFGITPGTRVKKGEALFPRLDIPKELAELEAMTPGQAAQEPEAPKAPESPEKPQITIDDFDALDVRVAKVLACEKVEKADKLLKFTLQVGREQRTVLSGIAKYYAPEELVGKSLILLYNLAPRKIRGIESCGMLLSAADADGNLKVLTVDGEIADGSEIS